MELMYQLQENAILREDYYNGIINIRLNGPPKDLVEKYFNKIKPGPDPKPDVPVFNPSEAINKSTDDNQSAFMIGFPFKGFNDPNFYSLSILSSLYSLPGNIISQLDGEWFKIISKALSLPYSMIVSDAMLDT
jgi:hypothetical protein